MDPLMTYVYLKPIKYENGLFVTEKSRGDFDRFEKYSKDHFNQNYNHGSIIFPANKDVISIGELIGYIFTKKKFKYILAEVRKFIFRIP